MDMRGKTVKHRIFLYNTIVILVSLLLMVLLNIAIVKLYAESIEDQWRQSMEHLLTEAQFKEMIVDWTILIVEDDEDISMVEEAQEEIRIGEIRILPDSWKVYKGEQEIKLPNREFEVLQFLAMHPNHVFSKEQIFEAVWGVIIWGIMRRSWCISTGYATR